MLAWAHTNIQGNSLVQTPLCQAGMAGPGPPVKILGYTRITESLP
jgi:hypothetical protein